jgi:hypothetical protein
MTIMADHRNGQTASASDAPAHVAFEAETLQIEIAQLRDLDLDGLRLRWRNLFGRAVPPHLQKFLLLRIVAYRMQANVYGDLGKGARRTLDRLAREGRGQGGSEAPPRPSLADPRSLLTGTLLMREWAGVMHRVIVVDDGFAWNGATYPSLSKVARAMTGTRWNGPRFFGMRAKRSEPRLEPAACDHAEAENSP